MIYKLKVDRKTIVDKLRASPSFVLAFFITALMLPIIQLAIRANSLSDTAPMELVSLSLPNGNTVDASSDVGYVDILGEVTDDLSGFDSIYYSYVSPSGEQIVEGDLNGDPQYINSHIQFPQYSEPGVWRPTFTLKDNATNIRVYTPVDLVNEGFLVDITVTSSPADTTAPTLEALTLNTSSVDISSGEAYYNGTLSISEDLSGLGDGQTYLLFTSPITGQQSVSSFTHVSGNDYTFTSNVRQYSEVGTWTGSILLNDKVGNTRFYDFSELQSMSMGITLEVTGTDDTTMPNIDSLHFTAAFPPLGDQIASSSKVTIYGEFSDNLSGVGAAHITYYSQTSTQTAQVISQSTTPGITQYTAFIPPYAATGLWLPEMSFGDQAGNYQIFSHTDLVNLGFDLSINIVASETGTVAENESVTTDVDSSGATPSEPFVASVTTPIAGDVTITQVALVDPVSSNDYLVFDQQYDISAPDASIEEPLILRFRVDASTLGELTASSLVIFRNGVLVEECADPAQAIPTPCVAERNTLPDDDAELVIRTAQASTWIIGYEAPTGPNYTFKKFDKQIKSVPYLNEVHRGSTIPVKFDLGGGFGTAVLPSHIAQSQEIKCNTKQPVGQPTDINTVNGGLGISDAAQYRFNWKTLKMWDNTCRQLILSFSNGEVVTAYFDFR